MTPASDALTRFLHELRAQLHGSPIVYLHVGEGGAHSLAAVRAHGIAVEESHFLRIGDANDVQHGDDAADARSPLAVGSRRTADAGGGDGGVGVLDDATRAAAVPLRDRVRSTAPVLLHFESADALRADSTFGRFDFVGLNCVACYVQSRDSMSDEMLLTSIRQRTGRALATISTQQISNGTEAIAGAAGPVGLLLRTAHASSPSIEAAGVTRQSEMATLHQRLAQVVKERDDLRSAYSREVSALRARQAELARSAEAKLSMALSAFADIQFRAAKSQRTLARLKATRLYRAAKTVRDRARGRGDWRSLPSALWAAIAGPATNVPGAGVIVYDAAAASLAVVPTTKPLLLALPASAAPQELWAQALAVGPASAVTVELKLPPDGAASAAAGVRFDGREDGLVDRISMRVPTTSSIRLLGIAGGTPAVTLLVTRQKGDNFLLRLQLRGGEEDADPLADSPASPAIGNATLPAAPVTLVDRPDATFVLDAVPQEVTLPPGGLCGYEIKVRAQPPEIAAVTIEVSASADGDPGTADAADATAPRLHELGSGVTASILSVAPGRSGPALTLRRAGGSPAVVKLERRLPSAFEGEHADLDGRGPQVADLTRKLWGGFSRYAQDDLNALLVGSAPPEARVTAAWELARYFAADGRWDVTLQYLRIARQIDRTFLRNRRCRLVEIEALLAVGSYDKAVGLASYPLEHSEPDHNYRCALSNIALARHADTLQAVQDLRLDLLNQAYRAHDLMPLALADVTRGFVFGNLSPADRPKPVDASSVISVLMPVYNAAEYLHVALDSMLAQTWGAFELVVVDDCSTDSSWEILQSYAAKDPRIVCVRNDVNMGAYPTRNRALALARGDFITVHDSDDWSHPQMLELQVTPLLADPALKGTFTCMARVSGDLRFSLRPERVNLEYVHRSYPSLLMRAKQLRELGRWDDVAANADDEFVQRARARFGAEAFRDLLPDVPMSLFLKHAASLTSQKSTNLRSLTYGVRHEYARQSEFWRKQRKADGADPTGMPERKNAKHPFPVPTNLWPRHWQRREQYDILLMSDLTLLGGTRRCNEGYIAAALDAGLSIGLFHWPRYDLPLHEDIAREYRLLSYREGVDIVTAEQQLQCRLLLIHHPPIIAFPPDALPSIDAERVAVLVNQLPRQLITEPERYYTHASVDEWSRATFGRTPTWIPISPLVRRHLGDGGYGPLSAVDWIPPLGASFDAGQSAPRRPDPGRTPVLGRHSRDHWTKWPETSLDTLQAYCADTPYAVRFLGGTRYASRVLPEWPANWQSLEFDSVGVQSFLKELDFFMHFTHSEYIEEFGRNVMEAMAAGVPVILPERFREVFGDAAVYCSPGSVASTVKSLWNDPETYEAQSAAGLAYVARTQAAGTIPARLRGAVEGAL